MISWLTIRHLVVLCKGRCCCPLRKLSWEHPIFANVCVIPTKVGIYYRSQVSVDSRLHGHDWPSCTMKYLQIRDAPTKFVFWKKRNLPKFWFIGVVIFNTDEFTIWLDWFLSLCPHHEVDCQKQAYEFRTIWYKMFNCGCSRMQF
jgi:hypothetical protein